MKYTASELLKELLKRNNLAAYVGQNNGHLHWLWVGGENNSIVMKGTCSITDIYSLRRPFRKYEPQLIKNKDTSSCK